MEYIQRRSYPRRAKSEDKWSIGSFLWFEMTQFHLNQGHGSNPRIGMPTAFKDTGESQPSMFSRRYGSGQFATRRPTWTRGRCLSHSAYTWWITINEQIWKQGRPWWQQNIRITWRLAMLQNLRYSKDVNVLPPIFPIRCGSSMVSGKWELESVDLCWVRQNWINRPEG